MFTQFFGNYLLSQQLVSPEHLSDALQAIRSSRPQLGMLAVGAGLMTAAQVEKAHSEQQRVDKRIGDVMVDMGYLTKEQVDKLLMSQLPSHLALGQALVDSGYMTTSQFEQALCEYKNENSISDADFLSGSDASDRKLVRNFYNFNSINASAYMTGYVSLLFKNLIRFIGGDFTPMDAHALMGALSGCVAKHLEGGLSVTAIVDADASAMIEFASRFTGERITDEDDYTRSCIGDFIDLQDCLFADNIFDSNGIRLRPGGADISELSDACVIPVYYSFGNVNFIISM